MLLGILLHASMSFVPGLGAVWGIQDSQSSPWFAIFLASIHGWRMPLFFLVSGFFTAMLWKKRGLQALLVHRFKRIFLPLLLSMVTIIPLMWIVSGYVRSKPASKIEAANQSDDETKNRDERLDAIKVDVWEAVAIGDHKVLQRYIEEGGDVDAKSPTSGATPLHVACFFGKPDAAKLLLESDASLETTNNEGLTPEQLLGIDWATTEYIANVFQLSLDKQDVLDGRNQIAKVIGDLTGRNINANPQDPTTAIWNGLVGLLFYFPVFNHLWFLWFLCWFVIGFAIITKTTEVLAFPSIPNDWIRTSWRYLWLIPLGAVPQYFMARETGGFGPDTSIGLFPLPAVMAYYAIFFGYGALYFGSEDRDLIVGRYFAWAIGLAILLVFPVGLSFRHPNLGIERLIFSIVQVSYAWLMSFGLIGLFHQFFSGERRWVRYLSDSSYWLYLTHIPLVMYLQFLVRDWEIPGIAKLLLVCSGAIALLLLSYQLVVRRTWLGLLLNGRR